MKFLLTLSFYVLAFFTTSANASDKHDIQPSLTSERALICSGCVITGRV